MNLKKCNTCNVEKDFTEFSKRANALDHWVTAKYYPKCKACTNKNNNKNYVKKPRKQILKDKTCTACKNTKPIEDFYERSNAKPEWFASKYSPKCKDCERDLKRKSHAIKIKTRPQKIVSEKKCHICKSVFSLENFYKKTKTKPTWTLANYRPYCIPCDKKLAVDKRNGNKDEVNRRTRARMLKLGSEINAKRKLRLAACPEYRERAKQYKKNSKDRFPIRTKTRDRTKYLVQTGIIEKLPCRICGSKNSQAHHEDYSQCLDVIWYCKRHHADRHRELKSLGITWDKDGKPVVLEKMSTFRDGETQNVGSIVDRPKSDEGALLNSHL